MFQLRIPGSSRFLSEGEKVNPQREGLNLAMVSPSQWPRDFAVSSVSAVAILCLDPKPDGVREKIDDSIWLLCLLFSPFAEFSVSKTVPKTDQIVYYSSSITNLPISVRKISTI